MAEFTSSNWVLALTVVFVVVGLIFAIFWYLKRADCLTDEDRLNIERVKVAWAGAAALAVLTLVLQKREKHMGGSAAASLI